MENIRLSIDKATDFISDKTIQYYKTQAEAANKSLHMSTGEGNDFLGWLNLPSSITNEEFETLENSAKILREKCEIVVVIGIGGSYLGARAVIEALQNNFDSLITPRKNPLIIYAGHNISEDYIFELKQFLQDKRFGIICISKSGTTTEPAIAFRILKDQLEKQIGKEKSQELIVCVTDKSKGALHTLALQEGYETFVIEDNIGGRFSVFSPVGLLPVAVAGFDIRAFVRGAKDMEEICVLSNPAEQNPAIQYAIVRNELYKQGKKIEILVNYNPKLHYIAEWWKQLYGESEGKENKGIFPAAVDFTTDLHSMGQWIQEGERTIFETVLSVKEPEHELRLEKDADNLDGLNFLAGKRIDEINKMAELGTQIAHIDGGVPNIKIELPKINEYYLGQLLYFFEKACGISGYLLKVNPFNQPGVEAYKKNMFALLGKPGYEEETKEIQKRI